MNNETLEIMKPLKDMSISSVESPDMIPLSSGFPHSEEQAYCNNNDSRPIHHHYNDLPKDDIKRPRPARFNSYIVREIPKSTEEKEAELMEYFRSHPFRANPIRFRKQHPELTSNLSSPTSPKYVRPITEPVPFHFHSDERAKNNNHTICTNEVLNPFHSKSVLSTETGNNISCRSLDTTSVITYSERKPTIPEPFHLRVDERIRKRSRNNHPAHDEDEVPLDSNVSCHSVRKQITGPFRLATAARHELHQKQMNEKIRQEEEERKKLTEFRARDWNPQSYEYNDKKQYLRSNNKHVYINTEEEDMNKKMHELSELYKTKNIGAFNLRSVKRHEMYQRQFSKKLKTEDGFEGGRRQSTFQPQSPSYWDTMQQFLGTDHNKECSVDTTPKQPSNSDIPPSIFDKELHAPSRVESRALLEKTKALSRSIGAVVENDDTITSSPMWSVRSLRLFLILCLFRVLNVLLVQSYFDPDEFWQTMEPAYCQVFVTDQDRCSGYTWEWKRRSPDSDSHLFERSMLGPARSYLSVVPVYCFFWLLKHLSIDTLWLVSRGPMILNAVTVAAPIDMAVWYVGRWLEQRRSRMNMILPSWCLFCSLSSWFNGYSLVRTFANCQEDLLLIISVALLSPELIGDVKQKNFLLRGCLAFLLGGLSVVIRFTAVAAFVPIGVILALRHKSILSQVGYLLFPCAVFGLLGILIGMGVDRLFYGFWTIPFLGNFHFNVILNRADLYGGHPPHWYFTAGLPAISGLLLPFALYDLYLLIRSKSKNYGRRNLWIVILSYVVIMSFNAHKEFRYILPVLPLICVTSADHVRTLMVGDYRRMKLLVVGGIFVMANLVAVVYLGLFHQSGSVSVNHRIVSVARELHQTTTGKTNFTVHYLTGACHSTPLLSHLHAPPLNFNDTWHLDCSPDCRSDPNRICESQQFDTDPVLFMEDSYYPCWKVSRARRSSCLAKSSQPRLFPDFIVTFSMYTGRIRKILANEGLHEIARYPQNVNGVKIVSLLEVGAENLSNEEYRRLAYFNDMLQVSLNDVVLFGRVDSTEQQCKQD